MFIHEVLKEINDDVSLLKTKYKYPGESEQSPLKTVIYHAFAPSGKFLLPEGVPPHKPAAEPLALCPSSMIKEVRRMYTLCSTTLRPLKREQIFIEMMERMHPLEANVLVLIKDQNLLSQYPNITRQVLIEAGYHPPLTPEHLAELDAADAAKKLQSTPPKKGGRPRGRPRKDQSPQDSQLVA